MKKQKKKRKKGKKKKKDDGYEEIIAIKDFKDIKEYYSHIFFINPETMEISDGLDVELKEIDDEEDD